MDKTKNKEIRLTKPGQIKRFLAKVMNQLNNGEIEVEKARGLGYLSQILLKAMEVEDLEKKVMELEKTLEEIKGE